VISEIVNGGQNLFDFTGRAADGEHIPAAKNLDAVAGLQRSEVLVKLTKEPQRLLCSRQMNLLCDHDILRRTDVRPRITV
jgi:hypothetical protein